MGRSCWKGPYVHFKFLRKKILFNTSKKFFIPVWSRSSVILSSFVGFKFNIHSGKAFKRFFVTREKIGYKFGEFCTTRGKFYHKNKVKDKPKGKRPKAGKK